MDIFTLENWTEENINFIIDNKLEESANLEFKAAGALAMTENKKEEIAKDVSAFANSDGGILIYGISEYNHKADSTSFVDGNLFNKEWLELIITTNISRRIDGIKIFPIRFGGDIKQTVYVVKIPVSFIAPHMVNKKKKYYKRFNFIAVEMEEYEVRQTYQRKENVKLQFGGFSILLMNAKEYKLESFIKLTITYTLKNIGNVVANEYKVTGIFRHKFDYQVNYHTKNNYSITHFSDIIYIASTASASIYPNESLTVLEFEVEIPLKTFEARPFILRRNLYYGSEYFEGEFDATQTIQNLLDNNP